MVPTKSLRTEEVRRLVDTMHQQFLVELADPTLQTP